MSYIEFKGMVRFGDGPIVYIIEEVKAHHETDGSGLGVDESE